MNNSLIVMKSYILTALIVIILMITLVPAIKHTQPAYVNNKPDWVGFNIPMSKTDIKMVHKDWTKETDIYLTTIEKELWPLQEEQLNPYIRVLTDYETSNLVPIIKDINKAIINKSGINIIDTLDNYDIRISTNDFVEMYNSIREGILVNNYDKALTVFKTYIVERGLSEIEGFEPHHYSDTVGLDALSKDK